ncbi:hypothetical protein [Piscirickettsia litoralis]|uniref:Uncharacterized protein n=1 Tax=Piscirickettsia litoralis TaxID=1891921 RepID=A0ABX3A1F7_9GAMM|nr:hypothetical protein [Piscirickettsia litoralis]ODN42709.1 hypothetical protein BGC07_06960 [Piscirickettsia litoralis]
MAQVSSLGSPNNVYSTATPFKNQREWAEVLLNMPTELFETYQSMLEKQLAGAVADGRPTKELEGQIAFSHEIQKKRQQLGLDRNVTPNPLPTP